MKTLAASPPGFDAFGPRRDARLPWFALGAGLSNLRQLVILRHVAVAAQVMTILVVHHGLGIALPLGPMFAVVAALAAFNVLTWRRVATGGTVNDRDLMLQLLVDVIALTLLLALSGGANNPFVGMFLLPLAITAASLPWTSTWVVALVTIGCHSLLVVVARPLFAPGEEAKYLQLLVAGMWVNYAITAGMIAHFVVRIAHGRRVGEQQLAGQRELDLCTEHLVRIGTLAAGAAHELAQPLSTATVVADEIAERWKGDPELQELINGLQRQLTNCQESLHLLLSYGRQTLDGHAGWVRADAFASGCCDAFRARRPGVGLHLSVQRGATVPQVPADIALRQGVLNLLGNAADVSEPWVELAVRWDDEHVTLTVYDRGPGIRPEVMSQLGRLFFTTKAEGEGNGLGLYLAQTAAERLGGSLELANDPAGGARARITLPRVDLVDPGSPS